MCEEANQSTVRLRQSKRKRSARKGTIIVLSAVLLIAMMALLALSIDTGYMFTMQTQLDRAVDSAALAGAGSLVEGLDVANDKVVEYLVRNPVGPQSGTMAENDMGLAMSKFLTDHKDDFDIRVGHWNLQTGQLEETFELPSAIEVSMKYPNLPLFFGRALGKDRFDVQSSAVAMYQPRDIMVVLDLSASMNDDSELKSISDLGRENVLANLQQIWDELELDPAKFGTMVFDPQYITVEGNDPAYSEQPKVHVEYRGRSVVVDSTKPLSRVYIEYSNGSYQNFYPSGDEATITGSGGVIYEVWVRSGYDPNGDRHWESFYFDPSSLRSKVKVALDLDNDEYPYPGDDWDDYTDYVRTSSVNRGAGFEFKFGFANLVNFWLEQNARATQTPGMHVASAQPITAVKDAVDVFMDYITTVDTDDRLGLAVYNAGDGDGELETGLTHNLPLVATMARARQAGHYHDYTNIGAGMETARKELEANGRMGAFKMIVLMTDGQANWHDGYYSTSAARAHVIAEANAAKALNYPIVTISLGAGADIGLMDEVAEITDSRHFNIPGGQPVSDYREDLFEVFREIADSRPLKIVQ